MSLVHQSEIDNTINLAQQKIADWAYQAAVLELQGDKADNLHEKISCLSHCIRSLQTAIITSSDIKRILQYMNGIGNLNKKNPTVIHNLTNNFNQGDTFLGLLDTPDAYDPNRPFPMTNPEGNGLIFVSKDEIVPPASQNNMIVSGGNLTRDNVNQLKFLIDATSYIIANVNYSVAANTFVVLANGDVTNPRTDAVVLNASGLHVIQGTPAVSPATPTIPSDSILVSYIDVPAGATSLNGGTSSTGKVWYVSVNGNDATAQPNNPLKPCATIQGAINKASTYDEVEVMGGFWLIRNTIYLKNYVNIKLNNCYFTVAVWNGSIGALFSDVGGNSVNCKITGIANVNIAMAPFGLGYCCFGWFNTANSNIEFNGIFNITDTTNADFGYYSVMCTGSNATYTFKGVNLTTSGTPSYLIGNPVAATNFYMENCYTKTGGNGKFRHNYYVKAHYVNCVFVHNTLAASAIGSFNISVLAGAVTTGTITFINCRWIDTGDWITITAFSSTAKCIFIGTNVVYASGTAIPIGKFGAVGVVVDILGELYGNNAYDNTITYNINTPITNSNITYNY